MNYHRSCALTTSCHEQTAQNAARGILMSTFAKRSISSKSLCASAGEGTVIVYAFSIIVTWVCCQALIDI